MRETILSDKISGRVRFFRVSPDGLWSPLTPWKHNDIMYDWASIVSKQLSQGSAAYQIGGVYLEFKNVADPDDTVTPPDFDRSGGISYYNGLATSPDTDYLRVPIIGAPVTSSDPINFPSGNVITFFSQSQGAVGVNGKPFGSDYNSVIYGGALVAIPVLADKTQDLVFSRMYVETDQQQIKLPSSQIGLSWEITLE